MNLGGPPVATRGGISRRRLGERGGRRPERGAREPWPCISFSILRIISSSISSIISISIIMIMLLSVLVVAVVSLSVLVVAVVLLSL